MPNLDPFTFVGKPVPIVPAYVVAGDDAYLYRLVVTHLRTLALQTEGWHVYDGIDRKATWEEVGHQLDSGSMFADRLVVVVEAADDFVSESRRAIEAYLEKPAADTVLILCVETWAANTKLARVVPAIDATGLPADKLPRWAVWLARERYGKAIGAQTVQLLIERAGTSLGALEQEIAKLAAYVGAETTIPIEAVQALVSDRMHEQVWAVLDCATRGQAAKALDALADQFANLEGDDNRRKGKAMEVLAAMGTQLRRLVQAIRLVQTRGLSLLEAMKTAGINPYFASKSEQQIRWLGLARISQVYPWLIEASLALRQSGVNERVVLERLVVQIAQPAPPKVAPENRAS